MNKFFLFLLCLATLPFCTQAQLSPEAVQQSTREWIAHKLKHRAPADIPTAPSTGVPQTTTKGGNEETNVSESGNPESEVHAAINPIDTNNIIAATMRFSPAVGGDVALSFPIYYTLDFGETWQQSSFDPTAVGLLDIVIGGGDPVLAFTPDGTAHLTWLVAVLSILDFEVSFTIYHATSQDKGATWQRTAQAIDSGGVNPLTFTGRLVDKEWLAVDDTPTSPHHGNLYAAYAELDVADIVHYRILMRTWNASTGFSAPVVAVDSVDFFISQFGVPTVASNGDVHLMWLGANYDDFYLGLFHAKSTDGGQSFSEGQLVSYVNVPCFPPMSSTTPCISGVDADRTFSSNYIVAGNTPETADHLYAVWSANGFQDEATPGFDVYFAKSEDSGDTWTTPVVLNQDGSPATHNFLPTINLSPTGVLSICWYDQRDAANGTQTNYYGITSGDGGNTFSEDFMVSSMPSDFQTIGNINIDFGVGEYNATVSSDNYIIPFWADGRSNDGNLDIYCAKIPIQGDTPSCIRPLTSKNLTLRVSPNPAHGQTTAFLTVADAPLSNAKAFIADAFGKNIRVLPLPHTILGDYPLPIPLDGLPKGTYFLVIDTGTGTWTEKIVVGQ
jgi:hypothetical protein